jgi:HSP20 family protein
MLFEKYFPNIKLLTIKNHRIMTVVRFKNRPNINSSFNNLLRDVFPQMPSLYRGDFRATVPVNIKETEKEFLIELVAPGMAREDFGISLENNMLTISAEKREGTKNEAEKMIRDEYKFGSFSRSFTLDEAISADGITAQYVNGVLIVNLTKKEEVKSAAKQISIS